MSRESYEGGEEAFWDMFRYDPDYPQTHATPKIDVTDPEPF